MSLVHGWFPAATVVVACLALLACVPWEQHARWRVIGWSMVGATVVTGVVVLAVNAFGWLAWSVPWTFALWLGVVVLSVVEGVVAWRYVRWRRLVPVCALLATVAMAATMVNATYQYFPTLDSLTSRPAHETSLVSLSLHRRLHVALRTGAVLAVDIPAPASHFVARTAFVWVPPAYTADPGLALPVVELLAGSPGSTLDWIRGGDAAATADRYAAQHHGIAPLMVMPDDNGSTTADTECVDGPHGAAETYLTVDVPAYMRSAFHAEKGSDSFAVAGLSEGGTCAVMLALRHRPEYAAFGDYSGLSAPTSANRVDPGLTTRKLFRGSTRRYDQHDPLLLLRQEHFTGLSGWFEVGGADPDSRAAQRTLTGAARLAGVKVEAVVVPGATHDFTLWAAAFAQSLPFLAGSLSWPART